MKLGVNGTPTIFVNGRRVSAKGFDELKATVEQALKAATPKASDGAPTRGQR
jgi:hypothetical protein